MELQVESYIAQQRDRLSHLIDNENRIINEILRVLQLLEIDLTSGLNKARAVAEMVSLQVYRNEFGQPDTQSLEAIIGKLVNKEVISPTVASSFHTIRVIGNLGSHYQENLDLTANDIINLVTALISVGEWFLSYKEAEAVTATASAIPKSLNLDFGAIFDIIQKACQDGSRSLATQKLSIDIDSLSILVLGNDNILKISEPTVIIRRILDFLKEELLLDYNVETKFGKPYFEIKVLRSRADLIWDNWAEDYADVMLTIWLPGVKNPLYDFLAGLPKNRIHCCVDFGCGQGHLSERLQAEFPQSKVTGLDYSKKMLDVASERYPGCEFRYGDMRNLKDWKASVDLGLTTNSLLPPSAEEAFQMFREVCSTIRSGGFLAGVLPSGDTIEHLINLHKENNLSQGASLQAAQKDAEEYYVEQHWF